MRDRGVSLVDEPTELLDFRETAQQSRTTTTASYLERMRGIDERVSISGLNEAADVIERVLRAVAVR